MLNGQVGDSAEVAYETLIDNGRQAAGKDIANYFQLGSDLDALIIDGNSPLMGRASDEGRLATIIYALDSRAMDGHIKGCILLFVGKQPSLDYNLLPVLLKLVQTLFR